MTKLNKTKLLATASVLALGALATNEAAIAATLSGSHTTNITADDNTMSAAATITDSTNDGTDITVTENGAGSQVLTQTFDLTLTGTDSNDRAILSNAGDNNVEVIVTSGNDTSIDLNVNAYGLVTSDQIGDIAAAGNAIVALQHNYGTITVAANGSMTSTAENAPIIGIKAGITVTGISNSGSITAHGSGIAVTFVGDGTTITNGLTNAGTISSTSGAGISVGGTLGGTGTTGKGLIYNTGTITSAGSTGVVTIADVITNSDTTGVGFYNAGTVSDTGAGVGVLLSGTVGATSVTNAGSISTTAGGAAVSTTADLTGTFTNSGTISYVSGDGILTGGAITKLVNSGVIGVSGTATSGDGLDLNTSAVTTLTNTGTIRTATGIGINADIGVTTLNNTAGLIVSTAGTAIDNTGGAITTLNNTGTIQDTSSGTGILVGAAITTFNNTAGTVSSGTGVAMNVDAAITTLTNSGTITSGGAITVDDDGGIATFTNTGTVSQTSGNFAAIDVAAVTTSITNGSSTNATAVVSATGTTGAIFISAGATGSITNYGIIKNTGTGASEAIQIGATLTGGIDNKAGGLITTAGTDAAINNTGNFDITTNITNAGTISSTNATPVAINLASAAGKAISVTNSGTITGAIALGTTDTITNTGTITGNITGVTAGANTITWNGGTITGTIDLGNTADNDNDTINIGDSSSDSITTGGAISGTEQLYVKFGTFNIGHAISLSSATAGDQDFAVEANATANVTDSITLTADDIDVAANATLKVATGKTLTISDAGLTTEFDVAGTGTVSMGVTSSTSYAKIVSTNGADTGNVNLASGNTLHFVVAGNTFIADNAVLTDVISADDIDVDGANLTGTTTGLSFTDDSYTLAFSLATTSDSTGLDVKVDRENTFQSASTAVNQSAVGTALESIGNSGDSTLDTIVGALDGLASAAEVDAALSSLTPDASGAVTGAAISAADVATDVIGTHLDQLAAVEGTGVATGSAANRGGVWGQVFGSAADQGLRDGVRGYQADTAGFAVGADAMVTDQAKLGLSLSYANTSADAATGAANTADGETDIDSYQGAVYGVYDMGQWYTSGLLGFTYSNFDTTRNIAAALGGGQAKGDFDGQQYTGKIGGGYKMKVGGGLQVTPLASLRYTHLVLDDYTETGTGALHVDNDDIDILKSELGFKLAYPIVDGGVTYVPTIRGSWFYDFIGDEQESESYFVSVAGTPFTTKGADVAQSSFDVGLGLEVMAQDNVTVSFDYDWISKEDYESHNGSIKARFAF